MSIFNLKTEFTSKLSKEVILERLHEVTNTTDDDLFVGYINDKWFNIHKKPRENVRYAFMPVLVGSIKENDGGYRVVL